MIYIRSAIFYMLLALITLVVGACGLVTFITFNQKFISYVGCIWANIVLFCLKHVCNVQTKIAGLSNLPKAPFIIASKHQSAWETIFFLKQFIVPAFVLKKELLRIPVYGWYLPAMGMIYIDRGSKASIKTIKDQAAKLISNNRITIIFPEGTRIPYGEVAGYKAGIYSIHQASVETPVRPVALNSGKIWPKKSWLIQPGTITIKFLSAMPKGLSKTEFLSHLQDVVEKECSGL